MTRHVYAIAQHGNDLYVGGEFYTAGGRPASCFTRWSGVRRLPVEEAPSVPEAFVLEQNYPKNEQP